MKMGETLAGCPPRIYFSRWVSLAAGVYRMILSGSIYMFAVYSSDLKQIFGYSTEEINLVGTLGNVGTLPRLRHCALQAKSQEMRD